MSAILTQNLNNGLHKLVQILCLTFYLLNEYADSFSIFGYKHSSFGRLRVNDSTQNVLTQLFSSRQRTSRSPRTNFKKQNSKRNQNNGFSHSKKYQNSNNHKDFKNVNEDIGFEEIEAKDIEDNMLENALNQATQFSIPIKGKMPGTEFLHHIHHQHSAAGKAIFSQFSSPKSSSLVSATPEWKRLEQHASYIQTTHLKDFLQDEKRCSKFCIEYDGIYFDFSRQRITKESFELLIHLARKQNLKGKIEDMMSGKKINKTENRAVLHTALRAEKSEIGKLIVDGEDVVKEVHRVLDQVKSFTNDVRSGVIRGHTGKRLRNIVSVGIGGSYLGPEFLNECLKTECEGVHTALGYNLRFLSNVDPVDVERTCADLDPEETLIVIISKTFTTAETMLNARTMRQWLWDFMGNNEDVVRKHVVACSSTSATELVKEFGIDTDNYFFNFWDWVGGRYSVCSAVGAVPISLLYGYDVFEKFLQGANSVDKHFASAPFHRNIPVMMGLLGVWNKSFLGYSTRTVLPYAEALLKFPAHIQQLDMESNGKHCTLSGEEVNYPVGEIIFGEAGTNGQHSFYQLLHMGQAVPCEFIGFVQSQHDLFVDGEQLSSHDELMSNFFAQPDALAKGKTPADLRVEGVPEELIVHKTFSGNRPSCSLLLPKLTAYATGQLLALYEHRIAVQGFMWDINSFDQWGVELGKKLATDVKNVLISARAECEGMDRDDDRSIDIDIPNNPATSRMLSYYINNSRNSSADSIHASNPITTVTRKTYVEHSTLSTPDLLANTNNEEFS